MGEGIRYFTPSRGANEKMMAAYKGGDSFYRDTGPKSLPCYVVGGPISILISALLSGLWDYKKCTARWEANVVNVIGEELKGNEFDQNTLQICMYSSNNKKKTTRSRNIS